MSFLFSQPSPPPTLSAALDSEAPLILSTDEDDRDLEETTPEEVLDFVKALSLPMTEDTQKDFVDPVSHTQGNRMEKFEGGVKEKAGSTVGIYEDESGDGLDDSKRTNIPSSEFESSYSDSWKKSKVVQLRGSSSLPDPQPSKLKLQLGATTSTLSTFTNLVPSPILLLFGIKNMDTSERDSYAAVTVGYGDDDEDDVDAEEEERYARDAVDDSEGWEDDEKKAAARLKEMKVKRELWVTTEGETGGISLMRHSNTEPLISS